MKANPLKSAPRLMHHTRRRPSHKQSRKSSLGRRFPAKMTQQLSRGFTLIELVVGMVVIGIALVMLTSMLFPQADRAAFTLHRVRSAELAHSVLNEIWGKRYDENTNANGGIPACGSPTGLTCSATLGAEGGEGRNDFDDIDDYSGASGLTINSTMLDSTDTFASQYPNYQLSVMVTYPNGTGDRNTKLIEVNVTTPSGEVVTYHAQRSNY